MQTFLQDIAREAVQSEKKLSDSVFVLPGKRACLFLKKELQKQVARPLFAPAMFTSEEFAQRISGLEVADNISLLFEFYQAYIDTDTGEEKDSFEGFSSWAGILINDFNEIDQNRVNHKAVFSYLSDIQDTEHWYVQKERTELVERWLDFWKKLPDYYRAFTTRLTEGGRAHLGLVYRQAATTVEEYLADNKDRSHYFIGFNALNKAEEHIFQTVLEKGKAKIFWDADGHFMKNRRHSASHYLRQFRDRWPYFQDNPFSSISHNYAGKKELNIASISKNVGQAKYIGHILSGIAHRDLERTAVVLPDENLLLPVIHSLPENVTDLNITMGLPLKSVPATYFFEQWLKMQARKSPWYYKDVLNLLSHPLGKTLYPESADRIADSTHKNNITKFSPTLLSDKAARTERPAVEMLFGQRETVTEALSGMKDIILLLRNRIKKRDTDHRDSISLESLYKLHELCNRFLLLCGRYRHLESLETLHKLFGEATAREQLSFTGEPYKGLQIMGLLETRALDYEHVIVPSVNEDILPRNHKKSGHTFIPYDVRKVYDLPTQKEADAAYAYPFYRLLHRAKRAWLLYNSHTHGVGTSEKSRYLMQIGYENLPDHQIKEVIVTPKMSPTENQSKEVAKNPEVMDKIREVAKRGFSPSALTGYIRNPMTFYYRYILGIKEMDEVEASVSDKTYGDIVHHTLEALYEPHIGIPLTPDILKTLIISAPDITTRHFKKETGTDPDSGKNLIYLQITQKLVRRFLQNELKEVENGREIVVKATEDTLMAPIPIPELDFEVNLRGQADRIDTVDGLPRITDYKTGNVTQSDLNLVNWEELVEKPEKGKAFQVLAYAYMYRHSHLFDRAQAGIVSFKNLNSGFLPFCKKTSHNDKGSRGISKETLKNFTAELKKLILEICNPEIPFTESENL